MTSVLSTQQPRPVSAAGILIALAAVAALVLLATVPLQWQDQAILGVIIFAIALLVNRLSRSYRVTLFLMFLSLFSTFRYAWWRGMETYRYLATNGWAAASWDLLFVALLLAAEAYAVTILALGYFQGLKPLGRKPHPLPDNPQEWPTVDVFIPTYNEPLEVVRPTVLAAMSMDWPPDRFQVHLLDDGKRPEFRAFAEQVGVGYFIREKNEHAKAGNINNALGQTSADLVAIFDCDHVPTRSFLQMTAGWFLADEKLAMLQTPHHFYSPDPFERNLSIFRQVPNEGLLFYGVVQDGNDTWNATFFCGSCAVMRRTALEEIGGVAVETVTEDAHTSLRMQRRKWNTAYINIPQAAGLATATLADHIGQRIRWARGMVQILRIDTPLFGKGLTLAQRLCYFNSVVHYLYALPRLVFLTAPLLYLLFGMTNMFGYVVAIAAYAFPHLAMATLTNSRIQGRFRHSFWNEVYETVLSPYILLPTMAALINPKWGKFNVTPKSGKLGESFFDWRIAMPFLVLLVANLAGIVTGIQKLGVDESKIGTLIVNLVWATANTFTLGAAIAVAYESRQHRSHARVPVDLPAQLILPNGQALEARTRDMANGGAMVVLDRYAALNPGEEVNVRLYLDDEPFEVPAMVAEVSHCDVRLAYRQLNMEQESAITSLIYGRADSWLSWRKVEHDRPLHSLGRIVRIAFRGFFAAPMAILGSGKEAAPVARGISLPLVVFIGLLMLLFAFRSSAATPAPSSQEFREELDFRSMGVKQPVTLSGLDGRGAVSFSLPVTKIATDAKLAIRYQAPALLKGVESSLSVSLNGSEVAEVALSAPKSGSSFAEAQVELPAELLMGDNTLTFQLAAKCPSCQSGDERQLKTALDLSSYLQIGGSVLPLANDLRLLPLPFFDTTTDRQLRLNAVFGHAPDAKSLQAAGVVSSWFGALADHRGAEFRVSIGSIPQGHAILFATSQSGLSVTSSFSGPTVALVTNPNDANGKLLVVYGDSSEQMLAAARGLVRAKELAGESLAMIPARDAARNAYDAPRWLRDGRQVMVGEFASAEQLHLYQAGATRLYFRLAPDLYYGTRFGVPFHARYKLSGLPKQATARLRWKLNGVLVSETEVAAAKTAELQQETIQLPVAHLYPRNTLTLEVDYDHATGAVPGPELVLQKDSSIDLTGLPHFVRLPRLDLFAKSGFPFTRMADLSTTGVVLPASPTSEQIGLYLSVLGFFGAQTGLPGTGVMVYSANNIESAAGKDLLVLGSGADQPMFARWADAMPVRVDGDEFILNRPRGFVDSLLNASWLKPGMERSRLSQMLASEAPVSAVIQGIASPLGEGRAVVAIATTSARNFEDLTTILERSVYTEDVYGSVSVQQSGRFHSYKIRVPEYHTGSLGWRDAFYYWMSLYASLIPVVVLVLGLVLARKLERWINQLHAERLVPQHDWRQTRGSAQNEHPADAVGAEAP